MSECNTIPVEWKFRARSAHATKALSRGWGGAASAATITVTGREEQQDHQAERKEEEHGDQHGVVVTVTRPMVKPMPMWAMMPSMISMATVPPVRLRSRQSTT